MSAPRCCPAVSARLPPAIHPPPSMCVRWRWCIRPRVESTYLREWSESAAADAHLPLTAKWRAAAVTAQKRTRRGAECRRLTAREQNGKSNRAAVSQPSGGDKQSSYRCRESECAPLLLRLTSHTESVHVTDAHSLHMLLRSTAKRKAKRRK